MATQDIGAVVSLPSPQSGQLNRSSNNFQFLAVPGSGSITASIQGNGNAGTLTCVLVHDIGGGNDVDISPIQQGQTFAASLVETGANYYIASPNGAGTNFAVFFSGDVNF